MSDKLLIRALKGERTRPTPFWLMRQAGRYLPEYREIRAKARNFLDFCASPGLTVEATLQPLRRYNMDAAILFSDILVVPHALGQEVSFQEGEGPKLKALCGKDDIARLSIEQFHERLEPSYETLRQLVFAIPESTALIGFAGAPWTVATYMIEGGSSKEFVKAKGWAYRQTADLERLIDLLTEMTAEYLLMQIAAGAEVIQLFDSWAGVLPEEEFRKWSIRPARKIVERLRARCPKVPIIGFPKGAGALYEAYVKETGVDAVSLDSTVPLSWAAKTLQPHAALQGNLDNVLLLAGGEAMERETKRIINILGEGGFVFNLGHGILQQTPPEHVARLADIIREAG
ncbi:Uroporphyrinogen decarboxylase [Rhodospirillaceae bacterium LM-1]|nr:Uroporphyrinogen decarboxylase [Rhodospirillaceae bacterium LM-1]